MENCERFLLADIGTCGVSFKGTGIRYRFLDDMTIDTYKRNT